MAFLPYLFFGGTCREAFTRYHEIFGGNLELMRMGDVPEGDPPPPEQADMIIHAALMIGDDLLMGSDDPMNPDFGPVQGMMVSYSAQDAEAARKVFGALAEGGQIVQEPIETFFSPAFAMCTDKFGTPWMVVADMPQA